MKIKTWLILSYIIVAVSPLIAAYGLYYLINTYNNKQELVDFITINQQINKIEPLLQDPKLYRIQSKDEFKKLDSITNDTIKISLYRADGVRIYSSIEDQWLTGLNREEYETLFKGLYDLKVGYHSYSIKKPVIHEGKLIGIYEITVAREQWLKGVENRTNIILGILILFYLLLFIFALTLVNRKIIRPLKALMGQMTDYANRDQVKPLPHHSNDEIGDLIFHFEKMRHQMDHAQKEVALQQQEREYMIASLSHDLKTPLTSIRAYHEALEEEDMLTESERKEYKNVIYEKIEYMQQMLDDLTTYTLLKSSHYQIDLVRVDGEEFFEMLSYGYDEWCEQKEIRFLTCVNVNGEYDVNAQQMIRLVDNLMSNALRHTKEKQMLGLCIISDEHELPSWIFPPFKHELENFRKGGTVLIVQNEGESIPKEKIDQMFQPFVQLDPARTKQDARSSGLGLSIAKMIIDRHHGKIHIWSDEEYGTLVACFVKRVV